MKKKNFSTLILVLVFLAGLAILLYPTVSDLWNSRTQSRAIADYESALESMSAEDYTAEFEKAESYNKALRSVDQPLINYAQVPGYEDALNVLGNGIIGYIGIPRIDVELPIYHGTSEEVLAVAAGHLEGTDLPVGGEGTHAVISAHRGLPSAKLFTNLDKLQEGDSFTIKVLDRTMSYEVDQIRIVEPEEVGDLAPVEGEDYVTLLTCTPYGINTHRLLVRGHRVENTASAPVIENEAYELDSSMLAPIVAAPLLLILLAVLLVKYRRKRR